MQASEQTNNHSHRPPALPPGAAQFELNELHTFAREGTTLIDIKVDECTIYCLLESLARGLN